MHLVIADDHQLVREALMPFIAKAAPAATVLQAATFDDGQSLCEQHADDLALVILDWHMPGMQGANSIRALRQRHPQPVKIVVLSGTATPDDALSVLKNGGDGFIPKSLSGLALTNALRLVLAGEHFFPSSMLGAAGRTAAAPTQRRHDLGDIGHSLSSQEYDVIELLLEGLSNRDIAERLHVQEVTIKKRLSNAYRKLGVTSRLQAVQVVNAARHG